MAFENTKIQINEYSKGKSRILYSLLWLIGLYIFIKLLTFELGGNLSFVIAIPQSFNFILHEMAHILTSFLPDIFVAAAGSFSELLLGTLLIVGAFKGKTYFASIFCFLWFMLACQSTADYMSDARALALPLVNFDTSGAAPIHDWNFVFSKLHILQYDTLIGGIVRTIGVLAGLIGLIFCAWLIYKMSTAEKIKQLNQEEAQLLHASAAAKGLKAAPPKHFQELKEGNIYPTAYKGRLSDQDKQK